MLDAIAHVLIDVLFALGSFLIDSFLVGVGVAFIFALPFIVLAVIKEIPIMISKKMTPYLDKKTKEINEWTEKKQRENQRSS